MTATEVLVPIKTFAKAKTRLSPSIRDAQRIRIVKKMAHTVLSAANDVQTWVVCEDDAVASWATSAGFDVLFQQATGLNGAIQAAMEQRRRHGIDRVIVAHGDLPLLSSFERFSATEGVVAVPNRAGSGTKVLAVPTSCGFKFHYGPSSATIHEAEAKRCGLTFSQLQDHEMGFEINTPEDLRRLGQEHPSVFRQLTDSYNVSDLQPLPYSPGETL